MNQGNLSYIFPGGVLLGIFGGVGMCRISKYRPNFRPKNAIFHTRFQTWLQKSIPVFRPDLDFQTWL